MRFVDVFNGDADGICALQQLRLAEPVDSELVTGVKRDIGLLAQVNAGAGDRVTVLDVSLDKNRDGLNSLLAKGAHVSYFDHHFPGDIPEHENLTVVIDTASDTCTSLLVDQHLSGQFRLWAITAAFGDNFDDSARRVAESVGLTDSELGKLKELGVCINYNAYGASIEDLHIAPADLFRRLQPYADPFEFMQNDDTFKLLRSGYAEDMAKAQALKSEVAADEYALYILPAESWARRVSGVLANDLAQQAKGRAHAILTRLDSGGYLVSVRAPLDNKQGADELCRQFPSGGGRKAAAGINNLPEELFSEFTAKFIKAYT